MMMPGRPDVPCGSCHACCRSEAIMLLADEGDVIESYEHEFVQLPGAGYGPILKHKPNGDCIYLGEDGCTIHDRAPMICRTFDCRRWFLMHDRHDRKRIERISPGAREIFAAGKARLASLKGSEAA